MVKQFNPYVMHEHDRNELLIWTKKILGGIDKKSINNKFYILFNKLNNNYMKGEARKENYWLTNLTKNRW